MGFISVVNRVIILILKYGIVDVGMCKLLMMQDQKLVTTTDWCIV